MGLMEFHCKHGTPLGEDWLAADMGQRCETLIINFGNSVLRIFCPGYESTPKAWQWEEFRCSGIKSKGNCRGKGPIPLFFSSGHCFKAMAVCTLGVCSAVKTTSPAYF